MHKRSSMKRQPFQALTNRVASARAELLESTANVVIMARRNEYLGKPVTEFDESIHRKCDEQINLQLQRAKRALAKIEEACHA